MGLGTILALICIALGFIAGFADADLLFNSLTWFVAAIAFAVSLGGVALPFGRSQS